MAGARAPGSGPCSGSGSQGRTGPQVSGSRTPSPGLATARSASTSAGGACASATSRGTRTTGTAGPRGAVPAAGSCATFRAAALGALVTEGAEVSAADVLGSRVTDTRLPRFLLAGPAGGSERREQKFVDEPGERVVDEGRIGRGEKFDDEALERGERYA